MSSNEAMLNFNMKAFYESFLRSIRDDQLIGCGHVENNACSDPHAQAGSLPVSH